jgi:hypothetical protein
MVIHDFDMCFFGPSWILVLILVLRGGKLWTRWPRLEKKVTDCHRLIAPLRLNRDSTTADHRVRPVVSLLLVKSVREGPSRNGWLQRLLLGVTLRTWTWIYRLEYLTVVNSDAGCCPRRRRCERRHADTRAGRISSRRIALSPPWYPRKPHTPTGYLPTELVLHIYRLYRPNQPWPDTEPSGCTSTTRVPRLSAHHRQTHQKKR